MKSRISSRKAYRKVTRKVNHKSRRTTGRNMRGGNTNALTYKSPFFVNMSNRYGANIGEGPALKQ